MKEKNMAREYPNDKLTQRVKSALKSGRRMHLDADGWYVDSKTGELIGPNPAIEKPLTKAQLAKAMDVRPRQIASRSSLSGSTVRCLSTSVNQVRVGRRKSTRHCVVRSSVPVRHNKAMSRSHKKTRPTGCQLIAEECVPNAETWPPSRNLRQVGVVSTPAKAPRLSRPCCVKWSSYRRANQEPRSLEIRLRERQPSPSWVPAV